jgi:hypothetical protein
MEQIYIKPRPEEHSAPSAPEPEKLFTIPVARICNKTYMIPARSKQEAEKKAYDKAVNDDWSKDIPDFEVYTYMTT